jgi:hypothetical protein
MSKTAANKIDHTPGGSPEIPAAAAPVRATVNVRKAVLGESTFREDLHLVDADHVWRTARAAAAMGMRNADKYDAEVRADAAADVVARVWSKAGNAAPSCRRCAGPRRYLVTLWTGTGCETATVPMCTRCAAPHRDRTPMLPTSPSVDADSATFTHCLNLVANYRRSLDAQRARDAADAAARAAHSIEVDPTLEVITGNHPDVIGTPASARRSAVEMLRNAGLLGDAVQWGPLWTLAYSIARTAAPDRETGEVLDPEALARELELSRAAVRKHVQRASERLAASGHDHSAWLDALEVQTAALGKSHAAPLPLSASGTEVDTDWRTRRSERIANVADSALPAAPVTCRSEAPCPRETVADWTAYLSPVQAARMERMSEIRWTEFRARTDSERTMIRAAAGLA